MLSATKSLLSCKLNILAVGLKDLLIKLHENAAGSERLSIQLGLFDEYGEKDQRRLKSKLTGGDDNDSATDVNFDDHFDLFDAVMRKIGGTPLSAKLLTILQSLSVLDLDGPCSYQQWDLIEQFLMTISTLDSSHAMASTILTFWQSRLAGLFATTSAKNCQTQTDDEDVDNNAKNDDTDRNNNSAAAAVNAGQLVSKATTSHKKRLGIKKRISAFLKLGQRKDETPTATEPTNDKQSLCPRQDRRSSKKKSSSYKTKGRGRISTSHKAKPKHISAADVPTSSDVASTSDDAASSTNFTAPCARASAIVRCSSLSDTLAVDAVANAAATEPGVIPAEFRKRPAFNAVADAEPHGRQTPSRRATSLDVLFDENSQCSLVSCRKLTERRPPPSPHLVRARPTTDRSPIASTADVRTSAGPSITSSALSDDQSTATPSTARANDESSRASTAPPPPPLPPPGFLSICQKRPPPFPQQTIRPIIPAPIAMLNIRQPRSGLSDVVPCPTPPPPPPPLPDWSLSRAADSLTKQPFNIAPLPPPPPPPLPGDWLKKSSQAPPPAPPPPASLADLSAFKQAKRTAPTASAAERSFPGELACMAAATVSPNLNEQFYTFPLQKCRKTKTLYWNKLAPYSLNDKKDVLWVERVELSIDNLNLSKIEDLFCSDIQSSTTTNRSMEPDACSTVSSATAMTGAVALAAPKIIDQVYLVDQKTSLKISLFLKQFRNLSLERIVEIVVSKDDEEEQLTLERLRGLQRCLTGVDQFIVDVQNYDGDYAKLGLAEKFLWHVGQHRFFMARLEVKCLQKEFEDKLKNFTSSFETLIKCCRSLRTNESLRNFLFLTLRVGNYLNLGSSSGPAAGFKISSVKQLHSLKSTRQNSTTLLHVIVENAEILANLDFTSQLADIHQAVKIDYESTSVELNLWASEVRKLMQLVRSTSDAEFIDQTRSFFENVESSLALLTVDKVKEVETEASAVLQYFCDELKLTELLTLLAEFFKCVDQAKNDNEQRKLKEQRMAKQKQIQEMRKSMSASSIEKRRSLAGPAASHVQESLVESLLCKIRDGDIAPRSKDNPNGTGIFGADSLASGQRRQRHFAKSMVLCDQSRERGAELPNLRRI